MDASGLPLAQAGGSILPVEVIAQSRLDYAQGLYEACLVRSDRSPHTAYSAKASTWFFTLQGAIQHSQQVGCDMAPEDWTQVIALAMKRASIAWVPGSFRMNITSKQLIRLVGDVDRNPRSGQYQSLKRKAMGTLEAPGGQAPRYTRQVDFGQSVPFQQLPPKVVEGFEKVRRNTKDKAVQAHYMLAENLLISCMEKPEGSLLLMLALTITAPSEKVHLTQAKEFTLLPQKRQDASISATTLITKMLWFLYPARFAKEDREGLAGKLQMAKKMGRCF